MHAIYFFFQHRFSIFSCATIYLSIHFLSCTRYPCNLFTCMYDFIFTHFSYYFTSCSLSYVKKRLSSTSSFCFHTNNKGNIFNTFQIYETQFNPLICRACKYHYVIKLKTLKVYYKEPIIIVISLFQERLLHILVKKTRTVRK